MAIDWTYWPSDPRWMQDWEGPAWYRSPRATTMHWEAAMTVAPTDEPVTLAQAKNYIKIDTSDDDDLIENIILPAARAKVEEATSLALMPQTWVMALDRWPSLLRKEYWPEPSPRLGDMLFPRWPVQSVVITYLDSAGNTNTVPSSTYRLDSTNQPARIVLRYGQSWPSSAQLEFGPSIVITGLCGSTGGQGAVDPRAKLAILRIFNHLYDNRLEVIVDQRIRAIEIPQGAQELIDQLTFGALVT